MGIIMAIGSLFDLSVVINMLTAVMVLVQCVGQIAALITLRSRQPQLTRPYRMAMYPIPAIVAMLGWIYVYIASGWQDLLFPADPAHHFTWKEIALAPGPLSLAWLAAGIIAFLIWAAAEKTWPFGAKEIREEFVSESRSASPISPR